MKFIESDIKGAYIVENFISKDQRGVFVKTFHHEIFREIGFNIMFQESYYSQSYKNVIRGMHFQVPPHDHEKLVYVTEGEVLDVVLDIRQSSPTYKYYTAVHLKAFSNSIFIPKGCAHGFLTLTDTATLVYNVTTAYKANSDTGIRWDSFGLDWRITNPVLSARDRSFLTLAEFKSPFE